MPFGRSCSATVQPYHSATPPRPGSVGERDNLSGCTGRPDSLVQRISLEMPVATVKQNSTSVHSLDDANTTMQTGPVQQAAVMLRTN